MLAVWPDAVAGSSGWRDLHDLAIAICLLLALRLFVLEVLRGQAMARRERTSHPRSRQRVQGGPKLTT
jgi:hypothetical protein